MPIFQDPDRQPAYELWSTESHRENDSSENGSFPFRDFSGTEIWETQDVEMRDFPLSVEASAHLGVPAVSPPTTREAIIERLKRKDNYSVVCFSCPPPGS